MISLPLAVQLKAAGLAWKLALHDFFAIPEPGLDERVFVLSDMTIDVEAYFGRQAITFNGAVEWALDYILTADVVWMPTEEQLRELLQERLLGETQPAVQLLSALDGYHCLIQFEGRPRAFEAVVASDAYALALLHVLEHAPQQLRPKGISA
ncbi:MAG: pilus assembly protein CpaE [Chloroflexi bacterium]|nr:pilus assembly protein CpaE [Chloroflexota bacterium]MCI0574836.1 pilus assembly protein CpaE [Chloroflexota bacterium]MCI0645946.1 pilus assembly protein CpaE [Chloroflexota bacterium]MCI0727611.1 pilus assembly protein CpaE [Chloroflexota bacterium]